MARRAGFTLAAVVALALGIGANPTVFGLVDVLLLRTLPVADPGRLVRLYTLDAKHPGAPMPMLSHLNWKDYREQARSFTGILGYDTNPISVVTGGEAFMTTGQLVSENYFQLLGVHRPLRRAFSLREAADVAAPPLAMASCHF